MRGVFRIVCLLLSLATLAGWAQPTPDEGALFVRMLTRQGKPMPKTLGVGLQLLVDDKVEVRGTRLIVDNDTNYALFGIREGQYTLRAIHGVYGLSVDLPFTFGGGFQTLDVRFPTCSLDVQWTKDGAPVTPKTVRAYLRSAKNYRHEPSVPLTVTTGETISIEGVPTGTCEITLLTELGTAVCPLTIPTEAERFAATATLQSGGMLDLRVTNLADQPMPQVPFMVNLSTGIRLLLTTDKNGNIGGVEVPAGTLSLASHLNWLLAQPVKYRNLTQELTVTAGQPATLALRMPEIQSLTGQCQVNGVPVAPTAGLLYTTPNPPLGQPQPVPLTWDGGTCRAEAFFHEHGQLYLLTDLGYARVECDWPTEQPAQTLTFPLQLDGGVISVTVDAAKRNPDTDRCEVRGKVPGPKGPQQITLTLPATAAGGWRSPQLPPGTWTVQVARLGTKIVTLPAGGTVDVTY